MIVGVLQTADGRCRGANTVGEFALRQTRTSSQVVDAASNFGVQGFLFIGFAQSGVRADVTIVEKSDGA